MYEVKLSFIALLLGVAISSAGYITPPLQVVLDTLSPGNKTTVCVHLVEKPNLSRLPQKAYAQKIAYLREFALQRQEPLIVFVRSFDGLVEDIKSFWVFNGISFKGTREVILAVAPRFEVEFVSGGEGGQLMLPTGSGPQPDKIEWNIKRVRAHDVWSLSGFTGDGTVVCIFDHEGMLEIHESYGLDPNWKWRDDYGWPNAWEDVYHGTDRPTAYGNHGTHVGGTAIGGDGYGGDLVDIGVAYGAKLIACTDHDGLVPETHECFEWIASLTDVPPYENIAPDVVNCSWGDPFFPPNTEFWDDIITLRNLGIVPVFCIGNDPAGTWPPGNFPTVIGVGATDYYDVKANFSVPGPAPDAEQWCDETYWSRPDWDRIKPDLMAPGTKYEELLGIYSADWQNWDDYIHMQGTSMSAPHIAGAIALMLEASNNTFGHKLDYYDIYNILVESADPVDQNVPNNAYGWGRLDCEVAIDSVMNFRLKSSSPAAFANNNQRKIIFDGVRDTLHLIYQSGKTFERPARYIRYTYSEDEGINWSVEEKVADGESPCLALDASGNPHCVFKDGNTICYTLRNMQTQNWEIPDTLFQDIVAMGISAPSFIIDGNNGYVAFETQNQWMTSYLKVGSFNLTNPGQTIQFTDIDITNDFRFGAPCLVNNIYLNLVVTYTREDNGIRDVYYKSSADNWNSLVPVSDQTDHSDGINPMVVSTPDLWFFWEEGNQDQDIYYRRRHELGWAIPPTPVFQSTNQSCTPRAFYNTSNPSKIYVTWSEYDDDTSYRWDTYLSAYYNGWQAPINISTGNVDSKDPDVTHIPSFLGEGKIVISYEDGNTYWSSEGRGKYLPTYSLKIYTANLPIGGGGPQSKETEPIKSFSLNSIHPNPAGKTLRIQFTSPDERTVIVHLYDVTGKLITKLFNSKAKIGINEFIIQPSDFPAGVYFVRLETDGYEKTEKIILLK